MGEPEELPGQGWVGRAAVAGPQRDTRLSRREAPDDTHASSTDPDAKLYRKSSNAAARLSYIGHALAENRHGLIVEADATRATGRAEREAALAMIERHDPGGSLRVLRPGQSSLLDRSAPRALSELHRALRPRFPATSSTRAAMMQLANLEPRAQQREAAHDPMNVLAALIMALERPDQYEIEEKDGELFVRKREKPPLA